MKPPYYSARLVSIHHSTHVDGSPNPVRITIDIPSYATGLAINRDIANGRFPITIHIKATQPPLPKEPPCPTS